MTSTSLAQSRDLINIFWVNKFKSQCLAQSRDLIIFLNEWIDELIRSQNLSYWITREAPHQDFWILLLLLSLFSRVDSVQPHRQQPTRIPIPGILQARTLEWVAISFSNAWKWKVKVKSLSRVQLFATPWTAAYQAPPSRGFSRQEYWSGVPLPSP